jgi:hypothetical protein
MAKATDDNAWLEELANSRDNEVDAETQDVAEAAAVEEAQPAEAAPAEETPQEQVPLATMLEERNKMQARIDMLEQRLATSDQSLGRLEGLRDELAALRAAQQQPAPEPAPDYLEDPKGYIDASQKSVVEQLRDLGNQVKQSEAVQQQTREQLNNQAAVQQIQRVAAGDEEAFAQENKDYWEALDFLRSSRRNQLQVMFPDAQPAQIDGQMRMEEFQTVAAVLQRGGSPAQTAYTLAKTMGYTAQQDNTPEDQEDLAEKRDKAQGLGGSGLPASPAIDELMGMETDEFDQAMTEMFGKR